jgi:hypothetical protein
MSCDKCKKLKHDLEVQKRSKAARSGVARDAGQGAEANGFKSDRDKALRALAELISTSQEFLSLSKEIANDVATGDSDNNRLKRWLSKAAFFDRFVLDVMQKNGIENVDLRGQEYSAGLKVDVLNLSDFSSSDRLVIAEVIKPLLIHRSEIDGQTRLLQEGRVTVEKRSN